MLNGLKALFSKEDSNSKFGIALRTQVGSYALNNVDENQYLADEYFTETTETASAWLEELVSTHTFKGSGYLVLSASHYYNVQIIKPELPEEEIPSALKWLVKDIVPIEPDDMLVDYYDSPIIVSGTQKINVICSHLASLKKFSDSFKRYQIDLKGIITDEFAFANLVTEQADPTLLICQQPFEEVFILIVKENQVYFSRRLRGFSDIGGYSVEQLNNGICESLSLEVQKSLDYYERLLKQSPVAKIKVLLPILNEDFVIESINKNTNVEVSRLDLPSEYATKRNCAASVGAMMELDKQEVSDD